MWPYDKLTITIGQTTNKILVLCMPISCKQYSFVHGCVCC